VISRFISRLGKAIQGCSNGTEMFEALRRHRYLSSQALESRSNVIASIDEGIAAYGSSPQGIGAELWRDVQRILENGNHLSLVGKVWGRRFTHRSPGPREGARFKTSARTVETKRRTRGGAS